ncbi:MAG: chemotaxis protein CheW [Acidobacteriota bacterium]
MEEHVMEVHEALENEIQVVAFKLGSEEYAVEIVTVQEIIKVLTIARVPRANKFIEGVINLRGNVIPVFNLHKRFGITPQGKDEDKRIIVFQFDDVKAAIMVDGVSEVIRIGVNSIEDAKKVYGSLDADFIQGVGKVEGRLLILLDLEQLLGAY